MATETPSIAMPLSQPMPATTMDSAKTAISIGEDPVQQTLNIIEIEDNNYIATLADPIYTSPQLTNPLDVAAAREWVEQVVLKQDRSPPATSRTRDLANMDIKTIAVTYGSDGKFAVRVYNPISTIQDSLDKDRDRRAALIMYHGGGWFHGSSKIDEGELPNIDPSPEFIILIYCRFSHIFCLRTTSSRS